MPGVRSLEMGQYYAHSRNQFWPIMQNLFANGVILDYAERVQLLLDARVAVWDVLQAAERSGSLDAAIVPTSEIPNDIAGFVRTHPGINTIFFNGAKAEKLFRKHVATSPQWKPGIQLHYLPSTSPAHAALPFKEKLEAWREVVRAASAK
jgi:double-stranded uracil-DNA glycosylase